MLILPVIRSIPLSNSAFKNHLLISQIKILICNRISSVVFWELGQPKCSCRIIAPRCHDVLHMSESASFKGWNEFIWPTQAILPFVRWSSVEKRFARLNGGSKVVQAVTPKAKVSVTAAIAEMIVKGSYSGHCVPV